LSSTELAAEVVAYQPDAAIVDFTIPFGLSFPTKFVFHDPTSPLIGMAPRDLPEIHEGRVEAQHIMLAWAAGIPSVRALSTVALTSLTTNPADDWLRQHLSTHLPLCAAIELPTDLLRPLTSAATSILYFGGDRKEVYFDSLASRGDLVGMESRSWFKNLSTWMGRSVEDRSVGTHGRVAETAAPYEVSREAEEAATILSRADRVAPSKAILAESTTGYVVRQQERGAWAGQPTDTEIAEMDARVHRLGQTRTLGELCEIVVGVARPRAVENAGEGAVLVEPRNLKDGALDVDSAATMQDRDISDEERIRVGDILLTLNIADRFAVALNGYNGPTALSDGVVAVRSASDLASPEYLFEYLSSPLARTLLAARAQAQQLSVQDLCGLPVPLIAEDRLQALTEVQLIERVLRGKADELQADRRTLFNARNGREFGGHLDRLRRRGKLLSISLQSLESLDYQIAVTYPFPIAYGYRLLQSSNDPRDLYKEQFRMAENMLAFLGSVSLGLLGPDHREGIGIDPQRGMTIGKWRDIVAQCSQHFASYQDTPLAVAIHGLRIGVKTKGFGGDVEEIVEARNEWAHMKDSSLLDDVIDAARVRQERLQRCMEALDFLAEFPIRQIQRMSRSRAGEWQFECACYRGDHPGLPQELVRFHGDLPEGDLTRDVFLETGDERWVPLYPFISVGNCPRCKWRETYYIDSWNAEKDSAEIKSFERGHMEVRPELARALREWATKALQR
jgi:hypothetical protein